VAEAIGTSLRFCISALGLDRVLGEDDVLR
jgi:hypothetical protein